LRNDRKFFRFAFPEYSSLVKIGSSYTYEDVAYHDMGFGFLAPLVYAGSAIMNVVENFKREATQKENLSIVKAKQEMVTIAHNGKCPLYGIN
jgi:hypothetical protein